MGQERKRRVEIVQRRLLQTGAPRLQVALILSLTAVAGFLTSFTLLHLGVPWMWLRSGLYKRVTQIESRHWLRAALPQTFLPAVLATIFFTIAGYALQKAVPEAHSIGEVWNQVMRS